MECCQVDYVAQIATMSLERVAKGCKCELKLSRG